MTISQFIRSLIESEREYTLRILIQLQLDPNSIPLMDDDLLELLGLVELKKTWDLDR